MSQGPARSRPATKPPRARLVAVQGIGVMTLMASTLETTTRRTGLRSRQPGALAMVRVCHRTPACSNCTTQAWHQAMRPMLRDIPTCQGQHLVWRLVRPKGRPPVKGIPIIPWHRPNTHRMRNPRGFRAMAVHTARQHRVRLNSSSKAGAQRLHHLQVISQKQAVPAFRMPLVSSLLT